VSISWNFEYLEVNNVDKTINKLKHNFGKQNDGFTWNHIYNLNFNCSSKKNLSGLPGLTLFTPKAEHHSRFEISVNVIYSKEYIACLIDLIEKLHPVLQAGGYGYQEGEIDEEEKEFDYLSSQPEISRFWSMTLLTAQEINKFGGMDKGLEAPCKIKHRFADDSLLLSIHDDRISSTLFERQKLRRYFGEK